MADSLLLNFKHHPEERKAIADLILAYGDLESSLLNLLQAALNGDTYTAVRAMYRVRSESNRLEIVDALVTPRLAEQKLDGAWGEAYAAMKCCMGIRKCTHNIEERLTVPLLILIHQMVPCNNLKMQVVSV